MDIKESKPDSEETHRLRAQIDTLKCEINLKERVIRSLNDRNLELERLFIARSARGQLSDFATENL